MPSLKSDGGGNFAEPRHRQDCADRANPIGQIMEVVMLEGYDSGGYFVFTPPESSPWICYLSFYEMKRPLKGDEPNAFHRLMQELILGFKWRYEPEASPIDVSADVPESF